MWHHWLPSYGFGLPLASGVQLFFVLSGFLITRILLTARRDAEDSGIGGRRILLAFYARRFLRIFPIYYAVVLLALAAGVADLRTSYPWHLSYTSNFYFIFQQGWHSSVAPFWSLAVEEQFYLFWPLVTLFLPRRSLPGFFLLMIVVGPVYRAGCTYLYPDVRLLGIATPGSFDSLALGALLAWGQLNRGIWYDRFVKSSRAIALLAIAAYVGVQMIPGAGGSLSAIYGMFLLSIAYVVCIHVCSQGVVGPVGKVLNNRALCYVGTISYCLYLVHNLAWVPGRLVQPWLPQVSTNIYWAFLFQTLVTFGFASLSWHWIEKPINSLKRFVPYSRRSITSPRPEMHFGRDDSAMVEPEVRSASKFLTAERLRPRTHNRCGVATNS